MTVVLMRKLFTIVTVFFTLGDVRNAFVFDEDVYVDLCILKREIS